MHIGLIGGIGPAATDFYYRGLIGRLKAAGAEMAAVTSMGGHFCIDALLPISPLPLVHGIRAVDAAIGRSGLRRIGVLGTRTVMETKLYGGVSSAELIAPEGEMFGQVGDAYSAMANIGKVTDAQREVFFAAGRRLCRERGAEAIMLGGTDLFLAFAGREPPFPLVDCADMHVDAIFARSSAPSLPASASGSRKPG